MTLASQRGATLGPMIDDFEAMSPPDSHDADAEAQGPPWRPNDDEDGWQSEFRSYLDDPE